jgi:hypothetical protein
MRKTHEFYRGTVDSFELAVAIKNFIRLPANCSRFVPSRVRETKMEPISCVPEFLCDFKDQ